jgi:hypothetical protein
MRRTHKKSSVLIVFFFFVFWGGLGWSQENPKILVTRYPDSGISGLVFFASSVGFQSLGTSPAKKLWVVLNDATSPVALSKSGINVRALFGGRENHFWMKPFGEAMIDQGVSISNYEVRFALFDVWGEPVALAIRTKFPSGTGVIPAKSDFESFSEWSVEEKDFKSYKTCVAYINRVRLSTGIIISVDLKEILLRLTEEKLRMPVSWLELSSSEGEFAPK